MTAADGTVLGNTKIVDHGPATDRWNMVILSEGYRASELPQFHIDAQKFVDHLFATAPFSDLWCAVNVYLVDVASTQSGADDPATCGDGSTGSGVTVATYFDATFCGDHQTRRLLTCDATVALSVARAQVPQVHITMVLVNTPTYGGSGGAVATFSTNTQSPEIGIHEMGHTFFGLIDEYGDIINTYAGPEPSQPNATIDTNRATNKWRSLILAATPMPTTNNPNCATEDTRPSPFPTGTVGTFEGAARAHCGAFRPEYNCRMRTLGFAFCAVCRQRIRDYLAPYMAPTTVTLLTPSISFTDIPEGIGGTGVTTYRAITFEILGCGMITLNITAGPTGGFGTPLGTSAVVVPSEVSILGRIWLSYTSTTAGSTAHGTVTVQAVETGQSWVINIQANTVARPKSAVVLVLDRSGSMTIDAGNGHPRVELLRTAVSTFVDVMQAGDGLGIVRFDNLVDTLMPVTDVGATPGGAGRTQAQAIVSSHDPATTLDPRGSTSIGGGIQQARTALDAASPTFTVRAMIVLTDGLENTPPMIADAAAGLTAQTFAIGFGQAASISTAALNAITQGMAGT